MGKTLSNTNTKEAVKNGVQVSGNPDTFQLVAKAWHEKENWMKSTKVANLPNGIVMQVTTQNDGQVAESVCFVPDVEFVGGQFEEIPKECVCLSPQKTILDVIYIPLPDVENFSPRKYIKENYKYVNFQIKDVQEIYNPKPHSGAEITLKVYIEII